MRSAVAALLALVLCGILALILVGASERRELAFTLGVTYQEPVARQAAGDELCQSPIHTPERFRAVRLKVGSFGRPGQPLRVDIRDLDRSRAAAGRVRGGYADNDVLTVPVGDVMRGRRIEVCVTNEGDRAIALYGSGGLASRSSEAHVNGQAIDKDVAIDFVRGDSPTVLSLATEMADRASLFHGSWVDSWTIWLLAALVGVGVPILLVLALRASAPCES
jgi:hypothetical protein